MLRKELIYIKIVGYGHFAFHLGKVIKYVLNVKLTELTFLIPRLKWKARLSWIVFKHKLWNRLLGILDGTCWYSTQTTAAEGEKGPRKPPTLSSTPAQAEGFRISLGCEFWGHSDTGFSIFPSWEPPGGSNSQRQGYPAGELGLKPFRKASNSSSHTFCKLPG